MFKMLRNPTGGDMLILNRNLIMKLLPAFAGRDLSSEEMEAYLAPYLERQHRIPIQVWTQELPFDGLPADNFERLSGNYQKLIASDVPLLMLTFEPGSRAPEGPRPRGGASQAKRRSIAATGSAVHSFRPNHSQICHQRRYPLKAQSSFVIQ